MNKKDDGLKGKFRSVKEILGMSEGEETGEDNGIIDFLSGAMSIKEAKLIEISRSVYVSVPKDINVFFDGENDRKEKSFLKI